jgi:hypothetical protein
MKMGAAGFPETLVAFYHPTTQHVLEETNLHIYCYDNLRVARDFGEVDTSVYILVVKFILS